MPTAPKGFFDASTVKDDWQYIDNLTTVTYYIRLSSLVPTTGGLTIPNCLFRAASEVLDNFLDSTEIPLHLWASQIPNGQVAFTATTQTGSPILTNIVVGVTVPQGGGIIPGQRVSGPGILRRTWITSVIGNTATMNQNATATANGVALKAAVIPKQNDVVVDINGIKWTAQRCDIQTFATRFRLPMLANVGPI